MALPFLNNKKQVAGLIVSHRKPDGKGIDEQYSEGNEDDSIDACSEDLIRALHSKDVKATSAALRAAFTILQSEPQENESEDSQPSETEQE